MRKLKVLNKYREPVGLDTIVYTNKTIDEVVYIDSDGKEWTLREIFKTNNPLVDPHMENENDWNLQNGAILIDGALKLEGNASNVVATPHNTGQEVTVGDEIYVGFRVLYSSLAGIDRVAISGYSGADFIAINPWINDPQPGINSMIVKATKSYTGFTCSIWIASTTTGYITLDNLMVVNMEQFKEKPSKDKMDEWRETYIQRRRISKETYTLREFMELNLYDCTFDMNDTDGNGVPNNIISTFQNNRIENRVFIGEDTIGSSSYYAQSPLVLIRPDCRAYYSFEIKAPGNQDNIANLSGSLMTTNYTGNGEWQLLSYHDELKYRNGINSRYRIGFGILAGEYHMKNLFAINVSDYFDELMTKEKLDGLLALYKKVKYDDGMYGQKVFSPNAKTKFDIAYTNKTIDSVEYIGPSGRQYTLRDIFGDGAVDRYGGLNNEIADGNFTEGIYGGTITNASLSVGNNMLTIESTVNGSYFSLQYNNIELLANEKFFVQFVFGKTQTVPAVAYWQHGYSSLKTVLTLNNDEMTEYYTMDTNNIGENLSGYLRFIINSGNNAPGDKFYIKKLHFYKVSKMFDIGDEPDTETFKILLDKWMTRKDLKQFITYEEIFEANNMIENGEFELDSNADGIADKWTYWYGVGRVFIQDGKQYIQRYDSSNGGYLQAVPNKLFVKDHEYFISWETGAFNHEGVVDYYIFSSDDIFDFGTGSNSKMIMVDGTADKYIFSTTVKALVSKNILDSDDLGWFINDSITSDSGFWLDMVFMVDKNLFDERVTKEQFDSLLAKYKAIRNTIIEPEVYVVTEPGPGLGGRYKMKTVNGYVYGHEMDFEDISFRMTFGINYPAYDGYNLVRELLKDNEGVIEYDWGKGSRYADVRLLAAPKTEKDTVNLLVNKWTFKALNPFYKLVSLDPSSPNLITNKNTHEKSLTPYIRLNITGTTPMIELENDYTSNIDQEIRFNFTGVTTPFELIIDCENKKITFADGSNAYGYLNMNYNSFFELIYNTPYVLYFSGCTPLEWTHKQWVVD